MKIKQYMEKYDLNEDDVIEAIDLLMAKHYLRQRGFRFESWKSYLIDKRLLDETDIKTISYLNILVGNNPKE